MSGAASTTRRTTTGRGCRSTIGSGRRAGCPSSSWRVRRSRPTSSARFARVPSRRKRHAASGDSRHTHGDTTLTSWGRPRVRSLAALGSARALASPRSDRPLHRWGGQGRVANTEIRGAGARHPVPVESLLRVFPAARVVRSEVLCALAGGDRFSSNTPDDVDHVRPRTLPDRASTARSCGFASPRCAGP